MLEPCKKTDAMRTEEQHEEHGHGSPSAVPTVDSSDAGEPARRVHQRPACAQQLYGSLCFSRATQHLRTAAVLIIAAIGPAYAAQTETQPPIIEGWFFAGNTVAAMLDILAANGETLPEAEKTAFTVPYPITVDTTNSTIALLPPACTPLPFPSCIYSHTCGQAFEYRMIGPICLTNTCNVMVMQQSIYHNRNCRADVRCMDCDW